ncbi:MAG TPA: acetamidase/formamidase family protein [Opitutaceae bacterium]|nr:acetamidase/formamidase family protein [Opitutaceae bacterium]
MNALNTRKAFAGGLLALAVASAAHAMEIKADCTVPFTPETAILGHFSSTKEPVATVKSGAIVRIDGGGGVRYGGGELTEETMDAWLKENGIDATVATTPALAETMKVLKETKNRLPPPPNAPPGTPAAGGHLLVGPVYIEDAEPGDSLEVRILDVTPRIPYGSTSGSPGRGGLSLGMSAPESFESASKALPLTPPAPSVPRPFSKVTLLDLKRNAGHFDKDIEIPLGPFMGVMATCPPDSEGPNRRSTAPGTFGGNLDCKELVAGSTLYLPVYQKGALFYTGDSHAVQGDGEVTGSAIETADTCTLQFILHKGQKLAMPRAETPTDYILFGLDPDLNKAMKQAIEETLGFLKEKQGLDIFHAYSLSSIAVDYHVTQVVDRVLGVHAMVPKKIFVNDTNTYWYRAR